MKKCIWCLKTESEKEFSKQAHTIPRSLGGKMINPNVCDECNEYFGFRKSDGIAIEEALKEAFIITKKRMQESASKIRNPAKKPERIKSRYFEVRDKNGKSSLRIKTSFKFLPGFQSKLCHYFKRGLYKIYLEELNRQFGLGFEPEYDFIREFARYNLGQYPVFYFERSAGVILVLEDEMDSPKIIFDKMNYLLRDKYGFTEIEFMGHVFGFPTRRLYEFEIHLYLRETKKLKQKFFSAIKGIKYLTDIDLALKIMNK